MPRKRVENLEKSRKPRKSRKSKKSKKKIYKKTTRKIKTAIQRVFELLNPTDSIYFLQYQFLYLLSDGSSVEFII